MALKRPQRSKKQKKVKKQHPKLRRFFSVVLVLVSIALICGTVACTYIYKFANEYVTGGKKIDLEEYKANQEQTSIIYGYDSNKQPVELLRLHGAQNRVWIDYKDIPKNMINAFRDLEDKRFNEHNGVDWYGTVFGVVSSGFERGASTITQQLIKNLTKEDGRTVSRKFYEILNALNVEQHYSKKKIMEFYLNTVYLGNGCYGIRTAAEKYFGKDVEDLNAAECAIIASITKAPATYDPLTEDGLSALLDKDAEGNMGRQRYCLNCMLEEGSLTQKQYEKALDYELIFTNSENYKGSQVTKNENDEDDENYTEDDIKFTDKTDSDKSSYYVEYVIDSVIEDLQEEYEWTYNEAWKKVFFGGLRIYTAIDLEVQEAAENVYVNRITFPDEDLNDKENPPVQSAITIMDYSGRVVAMVGGAGPKDTFRGLNRAADSPRQPGSAIKPISVYTPAIENNIATWSTKVQNYGIRLGSSRWPVNYGGSYGSATNFVTVQSALAQSLNTVPAQLMRRIGIETSFDFLVDDLKISTFVTDEDDPDYDGNFSTLCVGGASEGVTTLDMTAAFAIFGNNGYYFEPYCYYKVTNNDGTETLLKSGNSEGEQVVSESTAGVMRQLLRTVVNGGTGGGYGVSGFDTFAKTGTTSDDKDRWFVGGTPYYVAAVWYGYDEPRAITNTSGNPAGKIFKAIMNDVHEDLEYMSYPSASGVVARSYCKISGDIASPGCAETGTGYYKASHIPSKCKNCAMIHAIGSEIPDEVTGPSATEETTKKKKDKNKKTTKPATTVKPTTTPSSTTTLPPSTTNEVPTETEAVATAPETSEEIVAMN
ncbi:MAG: hypothetical protein E7529_05545 [Ruminococcaceae bacterium]|nr:hypothetical protein [Oscillospiraceae bacterium]